jgi:hypothetical protein
VSVHLDGKNALDLYTELLAGKSAVTVENDPTYASVKIVSPANRVVGIPILISGLSYF